MESHVIYSFMSSLFPSTWFFWDSSCCYIVFHCMNILPFVHSPMDGYLVFSSYQLLCVKLLWIFMFKSLFGHILLFFMGKYQECNCWVMPFYIPTINVWWFQLFHLLVIYCCIANSYKCRSLRQYTIIITQFMQVRNFWVFCFKVSHDVAVKVLSWLGLLWVLTGEGATSKLMCFWLNSFPCRPSGHSNFLDVSQWPHSNLSPMGLFIGQLTSSNPAMEIAIREIG